VFFIPLSCIVETNVKLIVMVYVCNNPYKFNYKFK
jgi:hypothetical protein